MQEHTINPPSSNIALSCLFSAPKTSKTSRSAHHAHVHHRDSHAHPAQSHTPYPSLFLCLATSTRVCVCVCAHVYRQDNRCNDRDASSNVNGEVVEQPLRSREEA